jgi:crotonobetainyl-CoA:carnitine CoA-transferase CaiB-like acyl-CoA transferase
VQETTKAPDATDKTTRNRPPPLGGVRVLDLSRLLPGPFCAQILGDFGAEVIKVEDTGAGDLVRMAPPYLGGSWSAPFLMVNRNKKSVSLNLKTPGGKEAFLRLARESDVVLEGFRPGVMGRLGLDFETLREGHPGLVYCALTGYGQDGPYRDRAGHDLNYLGYAGVLDMTGAADGPPVLPGVQVADLTGALYAVIGILLALEARRRDGRGQLVDVAMLDGVLSLLSIHAGAALAGDPPERGKFALAGAMPNYGVYETRDGRYLAVGSLEPQFWARACAVLELPALAGEALGFLTADKGSGEMRAKVAARIRERTLAEWTEALEGVDACVTPVHTAAEALENEQVRARGLRRAMPHPDLGLIHQLGPGVRLCETPATLRTPPPALGADTGDVLREIAGYKDVELEALRAAGAIRGL